MKLLFFHRGKSRVTQANLISDVTFQSTGCHPGSSNLPSPCYDLFLSLALNICLPSYPAIYSPVCPSVCSSDRRSLHPSIRPSVRPSVCLSVCLLSIYIFIYIYIIYLLACLSVCLFVRPSTPHPSVHPILHPPIHSSIHPFTHPFIHLSICLSVCLSVCLLPIYIFIYIYIIYLFACLSVRLFVRPSLPPSIDRLTDRQIDRSITIDLSMYLSIYVSIYLSIYPSKPKENRSRCGDCYPPCAESGLCGGSTTNIKLEIHGYLLMRSLGTLFHHAVKISTSFRLAASQTMAWSTKSVLSSAPRAAGQALCGQNDVLIPRNMNVPDQRLKSQIYELLKFRIPQHFARFSFSFFF